MDARYQNAIRESQGLLRLVELFNKSPQQGGLALPRIILEAPH